MRYFYAALTLLLGLVLLVLGISQLSAESEETLTAETQGAEDAPFTVVTDEVIDAEAGREEFTIEAEGEYTLVMGRTFDIEAWIGDAAHNRVTGFTEAEGDQSARIEAEHIDGEQTAPNPQDSDLWVASEAIEGNQLYRWSTPDDSGDWSLLIFRDGEEPAPAALTIEQTATQSQAGGIALVIGGGVLTLLAAGLFYWAARSRKETAGTDDDTTGENDDDGGANMTESPTDHQAEAADPDAPRQQTQGESSQRSDFSANRKPLRSGVLALLLAGGSAAGLAGPAHAEDETTEPPADGEEQQGQDQTDTNGPEEADAPDPEDVEGETDEDVDVEDEIPAEGYSVLLSSQLEAILEDIAETVEAADAEQDSQLLEARVSGAALQAREAAYRNSDLVDAEAPAPIGTEVLSAAVSSQEDFPRQAVVITEHPDSEVPQILVLEQESARQNYQLTHLSAMAPGTEFPSISAEQGGNEVVAPDAEANGVSPEGAVAGMAEFYTDPDHDFGARLADSAYMDSLHQYYQDLTEAADDTEVSFPDAQAREGTTALQLADGSMVVAGSFESVMQLAPLQDGDTIFLEHDLVVELVGTDWTTFPTEISSVESVVLHLPAEDSDEDVVLLGAHDFVEDASIDTPEWFDGYDG